MSDIVTAIVKDSDGTTVLGIMPLSSGSIDEAVNQIGTFKFQIPVTDEKATLFDEDKYVDIYVEGEGLAFQGLIEHAEKNIQGMRVISGSSLMKELTWGSTYYGKTFIDETPAAAVTDLVDDEGWTVDDDLVSPVEITKSFDNTNPFEAVLQIVKTQNGYARETATARQIQLKNTYSSSGITLMNRPSLGHLIESNDLIGIIQNIKERRFSNTVVNRIVPFGSYEGGEVFDLSLSTRSSPYTIESISVARPRIVNTNVQDGLTGGNLPSSTYNGRYQGDTLKAIGHHLAAFVLTEVNSTVAGDAIAGDILNNLWQPPKVIKTQDPDRFMMIRILPSIKQTLTEAGYDPAPKTKNDDDSGWDALVCFNGMLYQISDDYGYMRDDRGLYGIGSGGGLALGALVALGSETTTHAKASGAAKKAVNIAIQYNVWCGGIANTKTQFAK